MIRSLTVADAPGCLALTDDRGWPYTIPRWELLLSVAAGFGIDDPEGGLAAAVLITRYPPGLASIGTLLVASRFGRQGLGTKLMRYAMDTAGDDTVFLAATDHGRPLYDRLGFRALGFVRTLVGPFRPDEPDERTRPATVAEIRALDAEVFGADRSPVLDRLAGLRVIEDGGTITGYAAARVNPGYTTIGPLFAATDADARALITGAAAGAGDIRAEVHESRAGLTGWLHRCGLVEHDGNELMVLGDRELPGDRTRYYLPFLSALG